MATQISNLPLYSVDVETFTNEDARASFVITTYPDGDPLSLVGISFEMHLRHPRTARTVPLDASTANNRLQIAGTSQNYLVFAIEQNAMEILPPGSYLFDVVGKAEGIENLIMYGTWQHTLGITRTP